MTDDPRAPSSAPPAGTSDVAAFGGAEAGDDELAHARTPLARLARHGRRWLAAVLALALLLPAGMWAVDEWRFRRSASAVVATLEGELSGTDAAATILLVRTAACGTGETRSGSAFVVDPGDGPVVVTNRHVVEDAAAVGVRPLDGGTTMGVEGVLVSDHADVAVLEVERPDRLPAALQVAPGGAEAGTPVRLIGFPAAQPFTTQGSVAEVAGRRMLLDLEVDPGASGSPVVAEGGLVVGQVFAVTDSGLGVATPSDVLVDAVAGARPAPAC